jgi:hypothetical protein
MKRKRAHDDKLILKHDKKDQSMPEINNEQTKILEVRIISKLIKIIFVICVFFRLRI